MNSFFEENRIEQYKIGHYLQVTQDGMNVDYIENLKNLLNEFKFLSRFMSHFFITTAQII